MDIPLNFPTSPHPKVLNQKPSVSAPYKLAIIGEAPANTEVETGIPFSGPSGHLLSSCLTTAGILRTSCYVGNLTPYQPHANKFDNFSWHGPEVTEGLSTLTKDLQPWRPNLVLLLGQNPLKAAGIDEKISVYRGSVFKCVDPTSPFFALKCLATYHPSFIMQNGYNQRPLFMADIHKAKAQSLSPELPTPKYDFNLYPSADWICAQLDRLYNTQSPIAIDIEGFHPTISCISICETPTTGFIIPFAELSPTQLPLVLRKLGQVLQHPQIPKILQNGLFDATNLALSFKILINPIADDTMLSGWELDPELRKSLGLLASLYTNQPYYKESRKSEERDTFFNYCCTDSAVTYEIRNRHHELLSKHPQAKSHYDFNISLLRPLLYCQIKGIKYDHQQAEVEKQKYLHKMQEVQTRVNCRANQYGIANINIGSPPQLCSLLYDKIGLPVQHPKVGVRLDRSRRTTNEEACLNLFKKYDDSIVTDILAWRGFEKRRQYCEITYDPDGRIRSSYNLVGTVTGRVSSSKTVSGSGYNLQTIPKSLRHLFRADDDHWFFQCDLAGADGWTVAAYSAALGDPTMLDDYLYGIKPAKVIALMYHHGSEVNTWSRDRILEACQSINEEGDGWWLYFACKRVQHATSYDAKPPKISETITHDAYKKENKLITISPARCRELQNLYESVRYRGVLNFKNFIRNKLATTRGEPTLTDASGHTRTFHGRPRDNDTFREALSHLPQSNTTYATNLAMARLWSDPTNRRPNGSLRIEPLHQVHDAICGQFHKDDTAWAIDRLHHYFNNPLEIANLQITIPFDGAYGPSWGELGTNYGGGII